MLEASVLQPNCRVSLPHCLISPGTYSVKSSVMFSRHLPSVCADKGTHFHLLAGLCSGHYCSAVVPTTGVTSVSSIVCSFFSPFTIE